jgi:hypothetical protein
VTIIFYNRYRYRIERDRNVREISDAILAKNANGRRQRKATSDVAKIEE